MKGPGCSTYRDKIVPAIDKFNWCLDCGEPVQYALRCKKHEAERVKAFTDPAHPEYNSQKSKKKRAAMKRSDKKRAKKRAERQRLNEPERTKRLVERAKKQAERLRTLPDRMRLRGQVSRLRSKTKTTSSIPPDTIYRLKIHQDFRCACCGVPLFGKYDVDHIHPVAKGGSDLNHPSNLQLLTKRCNGQKAAKNPITFMKEYRPDYVATWARQLLVWRKLNQRRES